MKKDKLRNRVHRQSELFLKCVPIFLSCNVILQPFVKIVNNLMILKVTGFVCVCVGVCLCM